MSNKELVVNAQNARDFLKTYHVEKIEDYFGFGIILHTDKERNQKEKQDYVSFPKLEVQENSPAALCGLQNDHVLVAVNNKFICKDFETIESLAYGIDESYYQVGSADFSILETSVWEIIKNDQTILKSLVGLENKIETIQTNETGISFLLQNLSFFNVGK